MSESRAMGRLGETTMGNDLSPDPSQWSDERLLAELELADHAALVLSWSDLELVEVGLRAVIAECERRGI